MARTSNPARQLHAQWDSVLTTMNTSGMALTPSFGITRESARMADGTTVPVITFGRIASPWSQTNRLAEMCTEYFSVTPSGAFRLHRMRETSKRLTVEKYIPFLYFGTVAGERFWLVKQAHNELIPWNIRASYDQRRSYISEFHLRISSGYYGGGLWVELERDARCRWRMKPSRLNTKIHMPSFDMKETQRRWQRYEALVQRRYDLRERFDNGAVARSERLLSGRTRIDDEEAVKRLVAQFEIDRPARVIVPLRKRPKEAQHGNSMATDHQLHPAAVAAHEW